MESCVAVVNRHSLSAHTAQGRFPIGPQLNKLPHKESSQRHQDQASGYGPKPCAGSPDQISPKGSEHGGIEAHRVHGHTSGWLHGSMNYGEHDRWDEERQRPAEVAARVEQRVGGSQRRINYVQLQRAESQQKDNPLRDVESPVARFDIAQQEVKRQQQEESAKSLVVYRRPRH